MLLVLAFAAGIPAGTFAAALGAPCPAVVQMDDCCGGGATGADCMALCAVSAAPVVSGRIALAAHEPQAGIVIPLIASARASLARAPDAAPPKPFSA